MSYTDQILNQAQAALQAGQKQEAWKLVQPITQAEPGNARAWTLLADIAQERAPDQAAGYRQKAQEAEERQRPTVRSIAVAEPLPVAPVQHVQPMYQPSPAKIQLGQQIARMEADLAFHEKRLRDAERTLAQYRGSRTGGNVAFLISLLGILFLTFLWPLWLFLLLIAILTALTAGPKVRKAQREIKAAGQTVTTMQQQLAPLRMQLSMMM